MQGAELALDAIQMLIMVVLLNYVIY